MMQNTASKHARTLSLRAIAACFLVASSTMLLPAVETNAAGPYPLQCASSDLQAVLRIERHGEAGDVDAAVVAKAFFTLLEARHLCGRQQVPPALALYDSVLPTALTAAAAK